MGVLDLAKCKNCGATVPHSVRDCIECGEPVGFPNVRAAEDEAERDALQNRVQSAFSSARAADYENELIAFGDAVSTSKVVIARPVSILDYIVSADNNLLIRYHSAVRADARVPENNQWDRGRGPADETINPTYFVHIHYGALTLNGRGVDSYGACHITLREDRIAARTSVFEENPFTFNPKHKVYAGSQPPRGYRATWADRGLLAQAKLHHKLKKGINPSNFAAILVDQATAKGKEDFIEAHVYGAISRGTIEAVVALVPKGRERLIWRATRKKLEALGVKVQEL